MAAAPVQRVLHRARGYIGQHEVPMGSNSGPFVRACQQFTNLGGTGWPWCGAFCDRVFTEERMPFPTSAPTASAYGMDAWARKVGWSTSKPTPGALAVVNKGAGHICIVERYDSGTQTVWTIDGNVSDSVAPRGRPLSEFRGFIWHPALSKKPVVVPPKVKAPWWEVATSENGHKKVVYRGPAAGALERLPGILKRSANGVTVRRGKK